MAVLRLFASAREAAGLSVDRIDGATVGEILDEARRRYGEQFATVLTHSRVWVNGAPADVRAPLRDGDVVAVLPPVSGGSDTAVVAAATAEKPRLEEPLPFTKPESDKSESGWFRPHDLTAPEFEGSLARLTKPQAVAETTGTQLNGDQRAAAVEREPLSVVPDTDKPHVRLGIVWLIVTIAAVAGGQT